MAFCNFSTDYVAKSYTLIDNVFFARYLPHTPPKLATIYLYGLYLCSMQGDFCGNSNLEAFAQSMGYTTDEIMEAFSYWEEQGLVRVINSEPVQIQYLPIRGISNSNRRYAKDKYTDFNMQLQGLITGRMITPNEFEEYYSLIEGFSLPDGRKITPEGLLKVVQFCVNNKGASVNYRYIITVAQNWAREGFVTAEQIESRLNECSEASKIVVQILKALGSSKKTSLDEHEFYIKWRDNFDFTDQVILYVAKSMKKNGAGNFEKLDKRLQKYFELKLMSEQEIEEYEKNKDKIYSLARDINKTLGLYYDDVSNQVETFINPWLNLGFEPSTLLEIAQDCYIKSKRTLSAMNEVVQKLYAGGIVSQVAYKSHNENQAIIKQNLSQILEKLGIQRNVTSLDLEFWHRWIGAWGFDKELINLAVDVAKSRGSNLSYVNTILADWHTQNIRTVSQANVALESFKNSANKSDDTKLKKREYSKEEVESVFDNFNEIEL